MESPQVNTTCLIISELWLVSSGIGPQGKFQWLGCFPPSRLRIFHMRERKSCETAKESCTLWVWVWNLLARGTVTPCKHRFSMFCTCYFVALITCFLRGLVSLSLVLRNASSFKLVPFHASSCSVISSLLSVSSWPKLVKLNFEMFSIPECTKKCTGWRSFTARNTIHSIFLFLTLCLQISRNLFNSLLADVSYIFSTGSLGSCSSGES